MDQFRGDFGLWFRPEDQVNAYQNLAKLHAAYELAMSAEPCPFQLLANAIQPTVTQRDRWMCEDLGIPNVPEDMQ